MLKIKDSVDLKELEKFGFEDKGLIYTKKIKRENSFLGISNIKDVFVDGLTRQIGIQEGLFNVDAELNTIYDLIKADLVEKVD